MCEVDQDMRERSLNDDSLWDESVDLRNTMRMKEIVSEIGWPTADKVGEIAASQAWLLVQHADHDVAFQKECLALMKAAEPGQVSLRDIALLEDRVRVNSGEPQLYGTQFRQEGGKHVPQPIEDAANVNERRKAMSLDTFEENIARMYERYGTPKQD